ncbi:orotate phosphoribosyltransferase [bacterium]|nr:orotate phosphoribosyltransferase [bacterium]
MKPEEIREMFENTRALLSGHFILSSGHHSNQYLQCAMLTQYPGYAGRLAEALTAPFKDHKVQVVLGPAVGGIVIAQEAAQALWRCGNHEVRAIFCERMEGEMRLRRGFSLGKGERALVVEDVITTGGSVRETVKLAQACGAEVIGVAGFVDRSSADPNLGAPLSTLLKVKADIYPPDKCPLCREGILAVKPGSRGLK